MAELKPELFCTFSISPVQMSKHDCSCPCLEWEKFLRRGKTNGDLFSRNVALVPVVTKMERDLNG